MAASGGGVRLMPCEPQGTPDAPGAQGGQPGQYSGSAPRPDDDYEAERLRHEQAERRVREERAEVLRQMKTVQEHPPELKLKPVNGSSAVTFDEKAFACATWITGFVFPAARRGDVHEVRYLGQQVAHALSGETPGVACPPGLQAVPEIRNAGPIGPGSAVYRFYSKVTDVTSRQAEIIDASRRKLQELNLGHLTLEDLPALQQQAREAGKPAPPPDQDIGKGEQEKRRSLLEEARKALEEANRAANSIDELERNSGQVARNPAIAGTLEKRVGEE